MMMRVLFVSAALAFVASGVNGTVMYPKTSKVPAKISKNTQLSLSVPRGGAGPLDPTMVAKVSTAILLAQGVAGILAPTKVNEAYGLKASSPMLDHLSERFSVGTLSFALAAYCLVFKDTSASTALGVSAIPWVAIIVKSLLVGNAVKRGYPAQSDLIGLAIASIVSYACFYDGLFGIVSADNVVKYVGGSWNLLNGLICAWAPEVAAKAWGGKGSISQEERMFTKCIGYSLAAMGAYMTTLTDSVSSNEKALGYAWIVWLCAGIDMNFVAKLVDALGISKASQYFWMLLEAVVIGTLAVSSGGGDGTPAAGESP